MRIIFLLIMALFFLTNSAFAGEGFDAGYEWGQEHDIRDTGYSNGNSDSFNDGVRAYAQEQQSSNEE